MNVDIRLNPPSLRNPLSFQNPFHYGGLSKNGRFAWSLDESSSLLSFSRLNGVSKTSLNTYCQFYTGGHQLESHGILEYDKKEYLVLVFAESAQSLVLVHSLGTGHLVRALKLPFHISTVTGVSHMTLPVGLFISSPLQSFSGVIACGCGQTGRVVLIDLALAYSNLWPRPNLEYPREVKVLPFGVEDLPVHSTNSIRDGVHLALHLNGNYVKRKGALFQYTDHSTRKLIGSFEGVSVTAIHHFSLSAGLLVGYSFGGFQLYSLLDSTLLYSLPLLLRRLPPPVIHFAVQEPENDPKNFLYMWAVRNGPKAESVFGSSPSVTMYQMAFKKKMEHSNTVLYQCVEGCNRRFEHTMWPWYNTSAVMTSCSTIVRALPSVKDAAHSHTSSADSTLVVFMCRGVEEEGKSIVTVFDLNAWYNSQVPLHPGWSDVNKMGKCTCPYLVQFVVSCDRGRVLDGSASLVSFDKSSSLHAEPHNLLESLSMTFNVLSTEELVLCQLEGLRSQVVTELLTHGPIVMSNPLHYMSQLQCVGLVPIVGGVSEGVVTSGVAEMQYFILSVCLQYGFESVLMGVVESCLVVGYHLSLSNLIKWVEKTLDELVMEKNNMVDGLLVSGYGNELDPAVLSYAGRILRYFSVIVKVIVTLSNATDEVPDEDIALLYCTANVHYEIMETAYWCMETGLLPHLTDNDDDITDSDCFIFPTNELARRYGDLTERRESSGLALDHLIRDLSFVENVPFHYPSTDISCLLKLRAYPETLSQQILILYILLDVASPPGDTMLARKYSDDFSIDCFDLALMVWNIDHNDVPPIITDNRITQFTPVFELAVQRLLTEGFISEAVGYLFDSADGSYPRLRIQTFIAAGHVSMASRILEESGECEEYQLLLECFVNCCLNLASEHSIKVLRLQLSEKLLDDVCGALSDIGSSRAIHLALCLLLNHRRHIEAIDLAKENKRSCQLAASLADSNLLQPSLESMCSDDLFQLVREDQARTVNVGSEPFSTVLAKSVQYNYTSQADILLALTERTIGESNDIADPTFTPFKNTALSSSSTKSHSSVPKRLLTSVPFVSSPRHSRQLGLSSRVANSVASTPPVTPSLLSSVSRSGRKKEGNMEMSKFVEKMEGFKARMAVLSAMSKDGDDTDHYVIKTPLPYASIPATPTSILKPKVTTQTSSPTVFSTATTKRIRFALEDSVEKLSTSAVAIATPLPPSDDDSDSFYSLDGESMDEGGKEGGVAPVAASGYSHKVVLSNDGKGSHGDDEGEVSFVAEEEEEQKKQSVSTSQLKSVLQLTRSSLRSSCTPTAREREKGAGSSITTAPVSTDSVSLTPSVRVSRGGAKRSSSTKQTPKSSTSKRKSTPVHSSVMVTSLRPPEEYTFSPPSTVAPPPPPPDQASPPTQEKVDYVFSPPLLRSASRERKAKELSQFGTGLESNTPVTRRSVSSYGQKSKEKPLKSVKGVSRRRK